MQKSHLREIRMKQGLSLRETAFFVGCAHTTIARLEKGDLQTRSDGRCSCVPTFQAAVGSNRDQKRVRKTFPKIAAAKAGRRDALTALDHG